MKRVNNASAPSLPDGHGLPYHDILDALDNPVLVVDSQCAIQYANVAFGTAFGFGPDALVSMSFLTMMPGEEASYLKKQIANCLKSGSSSFEMECRLGHNTEDREDFEIRTNVMAKPEGGMLFVLHLRNICDLIRERKENSERELQYQALAEQAGDAFFVHDFSGRFIDVNRRSCESLGYTREELMSMSVTDVDMDFDLKSAQAEWAKIEPGVDFTLYGLHKRKDGTQFPVEVRFGCSMWHGQKLFLGMARDISERRQEEEKFRRMVEGAPDPIYILTEGMLAYINQAACRMFGIKSPKVLLGTPVIERVHPDYRGKALERIRRLIDFRLPNRELFEHKLLQVDGTEIWVETKAEPIDFEGKHGALVFVRDMTKRKITEQKLWESTERFRVAFEYSASGMCLMGIDGTFLNVNQAMCRMFDYKREQLEGKTFGDVTHPDDIHLSTETVRRMVSGEAKVVHMEKRYLRRSGEIFWAGVSSALLRDGEGKPIYFIVQIQDITEQKKMEKELREKEAFSRAVMDNLPIGIAVNSVFPEVSFEYMNDKFPLLYRTTREALSGPDAFWEAVYEDPDFRSAIKERVLGDMLSGDPGRRDWENIPITRNGQETRYVSAYNIPVPEGELVISTVVDVTQRIRDEQALKKNTKRLNMLHDIDQAILEGVDSPQAIAGGALRRLHGMLHTTRAAIDIFEPDDADIRVLATDMGGEAAVTVHKQPCKQMYAHWEAPYDGELNFAGDGSVDAQPSLASEIFGNKGICSYMLVPLTAAGKLIGALSLGIEMPRAFAPEDEAIAREVAAQLALAIEQSRMRHELSVHAAELELRVKERTAQLEAANKELEAFSYSVSHDLRAPLRSIDGYVQILLEDYSEHLDDNGKRICRVISNSARQMGRLIDDLLAFSRVGRTSMKLLDVDMNELVHSIYHELTTEAERAAIDIVIGPLPMAQADPSLLRQVWMNLLSNAIKFSSKKEKTVIRISGDEREQDLVYSVEDHGVGFDQQYAGKLFGVFQRLHSVREFEGTGVGLAIVQRIVSRHGGSVWAEGKPHQGATFYFSLRKGDDHGAL